MGPKIIWTPRAIKTFAARIAYLEKNWTEKEIRNFTTRVNEYLDTLKTQPEMFRVSTRVKDNHVGVIIRQVSLVYRYKQGSDVIELIAFVDNRQDPNRNKI